jgi:hypothetical protein
VDRAVRHDLPAEVTWTMTTMTTSTPMTARCSRTAL